MLAPKKSKFQKSHRFRSNLKGKATVQFRLNFGSYGLKSISAGEITARQIEAARKAMTRFVKRGGKIWIRVFPHLPISQKATEVPMGSGKGAVEKHVAIVKPGSIIFEMDGVETDIAKRAMELASYKLPVKCKFVTSSH